MEVRKRGRMESFSRQCVTHFVLEAWSYVDDVIFDCSMLYSYICTLNVFQFELATLR
jgi:hypothetical protein